MHLIRQICKSASGQILAFFFYYILIKVGHSLMLLWFADLMNVTEEVTIHRPNVSTLLSGAFIMGDAYLHLVRKKVSDV